MTRAQFLNALRILHSIDGWQVPELSNDARGWFGRDPVDFFLHANADRQAVIWREIEKRQGE